MKKLLLSLVFSLVFLSAQALEIKMTEEEAKEFFKVCKDDIVAQCDGVIPGEDRILFCLAKRSEYLTSECKNEVQKHVPFI